MIHVRRLLFVTIFTGLLAGCAAFEKADKVVMSGQAESAVFNIEYTHIDRSMDRVRTVSDVATYGALVAQIAAKML